MRVYQKDSQKFTKIDQFTVCGNQTAIHRVVEGAYTFWVSAPAF